MNTPKIYICIKCRHEIKNSTDKEFCNKCLQQMGSLASREKGEQRSL